MRVLLIEDEKPAARRLTQMVKELDPNIEVLDVLDSVSASEAWFKAFSNPDLVFMDIQLADGLSFEIFSKVKVDCPVIFTTAYDNYTLKAFKVNSVDYLLKPIDEDELAIAWQKFLRNAQSTNISNNQIEAILQGMQQPRFKERFLVRSGEQLIYLMSNDISFFLSEDGITQGYNSDKRPHIIEHKLEALEDLLDPKNFFRINRKFIININSISKIHTWFNGRLKLDLSPDPGQEVFVSRDRVSAFKAWLDD